jgi:hypothetical protein
MHVVRTVSWWSAAAALACAPRRPGTKALFHGLAIAGTAATVYGLTLLG